MSTGLRQDPVTIWFCLVIGSAARVGAPEGEQRTYDAWQFHQRQITAAGTISRISVTRRKLTARPLWIFSLFLIGPVESLHSTWIRTPWLRNKLPCLEPRRCLVFCLLSRLFFFFFSLPGCCFPFEPIAFRDEDEDEMRRSRASSVLGDTTTSSAVQVDTSPC